MSLSDTVGVEMIALSLLHPDPGNAKHHTDANLAHIRASIERFGFVDPIGVVDHPDDTTLGYMVVEGHGRLEAAKQLGLTEAPVILLSLDDAKRRGYGIAHNQIQQLTGMDMSAVAGEFGRLGVGDDDFGALGFSDEDVLFMPQSTSFGENGGTIGTGTGDKFSAPDGGEYVEQGAVSDEKSIKGYVPTVHRSTLRFASDLSYNRFLHLMQIARGRHPLAASMGERLIHVLDEMKPAGEAADADA